MICTSNRNPLVSVVMAVYDGAEFIGESITSVLAQRHQRLELIVVDDGSSDDTICVVQDFIARDSRVRLLRRPHLGHALALNTGISASDGEFIARIDHDDRWHPRRLSLELAWMERHELDVCGSWVRRFGAATGVIRFATSHEAMRYEALFTCPILDSATLFRGDVLRANPYPPEAFVRQEQTQCVRLMPRYRHGNLPRYLCDYRMHPEQKTRRFAPMVRYRKDKLCREHFTQMFPDASASEITTFAAVSGRFRQPLNREQLESAGVLFARRLQPQDEEARRRVRRRWRALCRYGCERGIKKVDVCIDTLRKLQ